MVKFIFFLCIFCSLPSLSAELLIKEKLIFDFVDLNKDNFVSIDEIYNLTNLIFQLIDDNKDKKISETEIQELKSIIGSMF